MKTNTALVILNTLWFGMFTLLIFTRELSLWWFIFPVLVHWRKEDFNLTKDKE